MKSETIAGLNLFYEAPEQETARLVKVACERTIPLLRQRWGLVVPKDCRIYVMTSWLTFLFHSAPWPWKVYLALTLPLVARKARATWSYAGGWSLAYRERRVVGVKPPRFLQNARRSLGEQIFIPERDLAEKVQTITCHELAHAFTFHLKLPTWLHEGLATLAMEYFLDRRIVREETLERLDSLTGTFPGAGPEKLQVDQPEALVNQYVQGYWLTRYLDETCPDLLKELLSQRHSRKELEEKVVSVLGKDWEGFLARRKT